MEKCRRTWGRATGRVAGSLLANNGNCFTRPCAIPGKTSARPSVCPQKMILGWQCHYVKCPSNLCLSNLCPLNLCPMNIRPLNLCPSKYVRRIYFPGDVIFSPASDDPTTTIFKLLGFTHCKASLGKGYDTKLARRSTRGLVLSRFVYRVPCKGWTIGRQVRPLLSTFLVTMNLLN